VPAYERVIPLAWQLPVFLLAYNLMAGCIIIWFIEPLNRFACWFLKGKPEKKDAMHTSYIDDLLLTTPSIAVEQTKKEIRNMMDRTRVNLMAAFYALINQDFTRKKKIKKQEKIIDFLNRAIAKFIISLSGSSISESDDFLLGSFCNVINDIERVGDYACKILKDAGRMKKSDYKFPPKAVEQLQEMFSKVMELFDLSVEIFETRDIEKLKSVSALEGEIDLLKSKLAVGHIMWLKAGQYILKGGEYLYSAIADLERTAHHLTNVALSVRSYPGEQPEEPQDDSEEAEVI
jgi:phosphate:Na+ symporter